MVQTPVAPVATSVTDRLLDGLAISIAERGYRETTVADVVRHAKTSKRTFYEQFATKDACLIELLRRNNVELIARINATVDGDAVRIQPTGAVLHRPAGPGAPTASGCGDDCVPLRG